jgi:phosphatidylglycerol:prolipoprotein diacylglycerol transferase
LDFIQSLPALLIRNVLANLELAVVFGSFYVVAHLVKLRARSEGLSPSSVGELSYWIAVGALIGGRLSYAAPQWQSYLAHPADLIRVNSGLYFYGALAGGLVAGSWVAVRGGLPLRRMADMYGLYAAVAIAITRFSCLLWNTCYGALASPPLGIVFPGLTRARYPSELYEGLFALALFGGLVWIGQRNPPRGTIFLTFLIGYASARALIDLTRIGHGLADPVLSIGVALVAAGVLWFTLRRVDAATVTFASHRRAPSELQK